MNSKKHQKPAFQNNNTTNIIKFIKLFHILNLLFL